MNRKGDPLDGEAFADVVAEWLVSGLNESRACFNAAHQADAVYLALKTHMDLGGALDAQVVRAALEDHELGTVTKQFTVPDAGYRDG